MENYTNKVVNLKNNKKYYIIRQALFKGKTYYLAALLTSDSDDFTGDFTFLVRCEENNKVFINPVEDKEIINTLAKNIKIE